jgi:hypothetical protein
MAGRRSMIYGEATTADGRGVPVTIDGAPTGLADKAGIEPSRLDVAVNGLIKICEDGAEMLEHNGPMLTALMQRVQVEAKKALHRIEMQSAAEDALTEDERAKIIPGINDQLARALDIASKVSVILDRVNKMLTNAVKAKDVAIRLRTYIATGDQEDRGLESMGENALRRLVNATANGDSLPIEERRGL